MVSGTPKTRLQHPLQYPFVTFSLYKPRFLGLNMIVPRKLLIDSRLSAFLFSVSNKTAPKAMKKAPFRVLVKINLLIPPHGVGAKVRIFFDITKNRHDPHG